MIDLRRSVGLMRQAARTAGLYAPFAVVFSAVYAVLDAAEYAYGLQAVSFVEELVFNVPKAAFLALLLSALSWAVAGLYYAVKTGGDEL